MIDQGECNTYKAIARRSDENGRNRAQNDTNPFCPSPEVPHANDNVPVVRSD